MALKKTFTFEDNFGVSVELKDCYVRAARINGSKELLHVGVEILNAAKDRCLRETTVTFRPSVDEGAKNFVAQAYDFLKTTEEFSDAVDC